MDPYDHRCRVRSPAPVAPSLGSAGGLRAVGIISGVLFLVNVVESTLPEFPTWMRIEMIVFALLMLASIGLVIRERV